MEEVNSQTSVTPFGEIAIALSGGGFRAASYSLGCLSYLERVIYQGQPLLKKVKFISSASGGSITALHYALEIARNPNQSFDKIFSSLYNFLYDNVAVSEAFKTLRSNEPWKNRKHKGRNLINSFAITYDLALFKGAQFGELTNSHLQVICINSTEFNYGISFRFQLGSGKVGNSRLTISPSVAHQFKLGDVLAASSCFPLGFEPIMMPDDFTHSNLTPDQIRDATTSDQSFGLMDGGITDNQGIHSFLLAEERKFKDNEKGYDLFIYCDVSSQLMEGYQLPIEKKSLMGNFSVQFFINFFKSSPLLFIASLWLIWLRDIQSWWMISLATLTALFSATYFVSLIILLKTKKKAKSKKSTWLITVFQYINEILFTRSSAFIQMLRARIKSTGILVGDVYLKQIRRLTITSLYSNLQSGKKWQYHAVANMIYDLSSKSMPLKNTFCAGLKDRNGNPIVLTPSQQMTKIADLAQEMDTTLWFDEFHIKEGRREALIATGQFTTCYNLIEYICKLEKEKMVDPQLLTLREELLADWANFNSNALYLATPSEYANPGKKW